VVSDDQPEAREGQAGPGVVERFVVPREPGNAGGGNGPQFKTDAIRQIVNLLAQPLHLGHAPSPMPVVRTGHIFQVTGGGKMVCVRLSIENRFQVQTMVSIYLKISSVPSNRVKRAAVGLRTIVRCSKPISGRTDPGVRFSQSIGVPYP
jgi:hypothetical protein